MPSEEARVRPSLSRPKPVQQDQTLKKRRGVETYKFFQNWLRVTFRCVGGVFIVCHPVQPVYAFSRVSRVCKPLEGVCKMFWWFYDGWFLLNRPPRIFFWFFAGGFYFSWFFAGGFHFHDSTAQNFSPANLTANFDDRVGFFFDEKAAEVQGKCAGPRTPDDVALRVSRTLQKDT